MDHVERTSQIDPEFSSGWIGVALFLAPSPLEQDYILRSSEKSNIRRCKAGGIPDYGTRSWTTRFGEMAVNVKSRRWLWSDGQGRWNMLLQTCDVGKRWNSTR